MMRGSGGVAGGYRVRTNLNFKSGSSGGKKFSISGEAFGIGADEEDDDMSEATYLNSFLIISSQKNCIQSFSGYVLLKKLDLIIFLSPLRFQASCFPFIVLLCNEMSKIN